MKRRFLMYLFPALLVIFSCSKKSDSDPNTIAENSWTFTEGSKVYSGTFAFGTASLVTGPQANNTYTFNMLGIESSTGHLFSIALSLLDLDFTTKNYRSGIDGTDNHLNAFYFSETTLSVDTYKSSNMEPGPVMDYTITAYEAASDVVTIEFSGQAQLQGGTYVNITRGKLKVKIDRV